jgi:hypothetical protein
MGIEFCDLHPDRSTIRQTNKNIRGYASHFILPA